MFNDYVRNTKLLNVCLHVCNLHYTLHWSTNNDTISKHTFGCVYIIDNKPLVRRYRESRDLLTSSFYWTFLLNIVWYCFSFRVPIDFMIYATLVVNSILHFILKKETQVYSSNSFFFSSFNWHLQLSPRCIPLIRIVLRVIVCSRAWIGLV